MQGASGLWPTCSVLYTHKHTFTCLKPVLLSRLWYIECQWVHLIYHTQPCLFSSLDMSRPRWNCLTFGDGIGPILGKKTNSVGWCTQKYWINMEWVCVLSLNKLEQQWHLVLERTEWFGTVCSWMNWMNETSADRLNKRGMWVRLVYQSHSEKNVKSVALKRRQYKNE